MTATALDKPAPAALDPATVASVLLSGDLSKLTDVQRLSYVTRVCETLGLNPLTQPFKFIVLSGKLTLYASKDATEQLRKVHGVSITEVTSTQVQDVFVVTAKAVDRTGRTDTSTGAVTIGTLKGDALANALMRAETKSKRRVTLSICGLGILDETELDTIPREPQYTVKAPARAPLPTGTVQILEVVPKEKHGAEWAEVTFVDGEGVEQTLPTRADGKGAARTLCETLAQEGVPVVITTAVTPRSKKTVIETVQRWTSVIADNKMLDAEIAEKEQPF